MPAILRGPKRAPVTKYHGLVPQPPLAHVLSFAIPTGVAAALRVPVALCVVHTWICNKLASRMSTRSGACGSRYVGARHMAPCVCWPGAIQCHIHVHHMPWLPGRAHLGLAPANCWIHAARGGVCPSGAMTLQCKRGHAPQRCLVGWDGPCRAGLR